MQRRHVPPPHARACRAMMNLNRPHSLEDRSLVLVGVMAQYEPVTNLKRVSLLLYFLFNKSLSRRSKIVLRNLCIAQQGAIHVRRHCAHSHVLHVDRDHLDQQRLRIAVVVHSTVLSLWSPELRFTEDQKVVHCDFWSEAGKLFDKCGNLIDQRTAIGLLKKLLIDKTSKLSTVARGA